MLLVLSQFRDVAFVAVDYGEFRERGELGYFWA